MTKDQPSNLPQLLRDAERRVNDHVWGDRRAIVSIPADVSRDVDILLLTAADEIERLRRVKSAAERLLSLVEAKGEPRDGPENQKLLAAGDTIAVNEGNLWALLMELKS